MTLSGILSSPSQRRSFLLGSFTLIVFVVILIIGIALYAPTSSVWNAINSLLISFVASGIFAIFGGLYISYFFIDPQEIESKSVLLSQDIGPALKCMAYSATNYRIFVRTGRHFRAEILPILIKKTKESRCPIRIEVILLDFRDSVVCEKYAAFRRAASFDKHVWDTDYVRSEILATIIALIDASKNNSGLVEVELFLSKRLSTFRIEGSSTEIVITREDPKDTALRYLSQHRDFSAYVSEFTLIRDESAKIEEVGRKEWDTLSEIFPNEAETIKNLEARAIKATKAESPYVR